MNKKVISALLCGAMVLGTVSPVFAAGAAEGKTFAIVTKAAGNPYNEKEAQGFKEVIEAEGGTAIVKHPETATADAQISVIQSLISQQVDGICIAGNDTLQCMVFQNIFLKGLFVFGLAGHGRLRNNYRSPRSFGQGIEQVLHER